MATIKFTTTADSGSGSLRSAISSASAGDVIVPDADVFSGEEVTILLSSALSINKLLTIDGYGKRIVLNGQGVSRGISMTANSNATIRSFAFTNGYQTNGGAISKTGAGSGRLERCIIAGCEATNAGGAIYVGANAALDVADSLIIGNIGNKAAVYYEQTATGEIARTTAVGNYSRDKSDAYMTLYNCSELVSLRDTLIDAKRSTASPTLYNSTVGVGASNFTDIPAFSGLSVWTPTQWESWDARLKAASPYITGSTSSAGEIDVAGVSRKSGGALGAYEYVAPKEKIWKLSAWAITTSGGTTEEGEDAKMWTVNVWADADTGAWNVDAWAELDDGVWNVSAWALDPQEDD